MVADELFNGALGRALSELESGGAFDRLTDADGTRKKLDAAAREAIGDIERAASAELQRLEEAAAALGAELEGAAASLATSGDTVAAQFVQLRRDLAKNAVTIHDLEQASSTAEVRLQQLREAERATDVEVPAPRASRRANASSLKRAQAEKERTENALEEARNARGLIAERTRETQRALMTQLLSGPEPDPTLSAAQARVDASREDAVRALAERGILPLWRETLNQLLEREHGWRYLTSLAGATPTGLSALPDPGREVAMDANDRMTRILSQIPGGSIGISGPRGAGKTTLIRSFCHADLPPRKAPRLAAMVNAPVTYAPLDFALHLFDTACRATLPAGEKVDALEGSTDSERNRSDGLVRAATLVALGIGLVLAGAGILLGINAVRNAGVTDTAQQLLIAGLLGSGAAVICVQAVRAGRDQTVGVSSDPPFGPGLPWRSIVVSVAAAALAASGVATFLAMTVSNWDTLTWLGVVAGAAAGPPLLVLLPRWIASLRPDRLWLAAGVGLVAGAGTVAAAAGSGDPLGPPAPLGAALLLAATVVTPALATSVRGRASITQIRESPGSSSQRRVVTTFMVARLVEALVATGTAVTVVGLVLIGSAWLNDPPTTTLGGAFALVAAGYALTVGVTRPILVGMPSVEIPTDRAQAENADGWAAHLSSERLGHLEALARESLLRIRYQRGASAGWSTKVGFSGGALSLPVSAEAAATASRTSTEQPMSHPEAIAALREFLRTAATTANGMIIGIDELDKMASDDEAERFLNDIKAIFGIPMCYFLISVSEDAVASFERRGMPFRDIFDSAFDDVLRISHLDAPGTDEMLSARTLEMPLPFKELCHALAGGLPRDVIRIARRLFDLRDEGGKVELAGLCKDLTAVELNSKRDGTVTAATRLGGRADATELLRWLGGTPPKPEFATLQRALVSRPAIDVSGDDEAAAARRALDRLAREFAAYWYLCVTLTEFFDGRRRAVDFQQAEAAGDARSFEQLAQARQAFTIDPDLAWDRVSAFRTCWKLQKLELATVPSPSGPGAPAAAPAA